MKRKPKDKWPVVLGFAGCPLTRRKFRKCDVIALIATGLFPDVEEQFPELAIHLREKTK